MKKLGNLQPTERLLISRGNSRVLSAPGRAAFAAFGLNEYEDATLPRIYGCSLSYPDDSRVDQLPGNVVRFTTLRSSRRNASQSRKSS